MSDRQERIIKEFIQFLSGVFLLNILKVFWIFPIKRNRIFLLVIKENNILAILNMFMNIYTIRRNLT